jgi:N-acylglucosamine-6-phosphate 2-epimerase
MEKASFFDQIKGGLIVSCYAHHDYNVPFSTCEPMLALAGSIEKGGAAAIRVNLKHVRYLKERLHIPIYGIEKIYHGDQMRITPTLKEVEALVAAGADAIAIDATKRERFDELTLEEYIHEIKRNFDIPLLGDISTFDEGMCAEEYGIDAVSTTLSGYTPYSPTFGKLGDIPPAPPDFKLITDLRAALSIPVIAEGRIGIPEHAQQALQAGAHAVVVGTAISNPQKITELFVHYMQVAG